LTKVNEETELRTVRWSSGSSSKATVNREPWTVFNREFRQWPAN